MREPSTRGRGITGSGNTIVSNPLGISAVEVAREDIDHNEIIQLSSENDYSELTQLLDSNIAQDDRHILNIACKPETSTRGNRIVWVESAVNREYVRIEVSSDAIEKKLNQLALPSSSYSKADASNDQTNNENRGIREYVWIVDPPPPLKGTATVSPKIIDHADDQNNNGLADAMKLLYAFIQGILAGFSFSTVFAQSGTGADDATFLQLYQPLAENTRRFFYLLSSISCVGAWDVFLTTIMKQPTTKQAIGYPTDSERIISSTIAVAVALLQSIGFLMSIISAKYDTLISDRFGDVTSDWIMHSLQNSKYKEFIAGWRRLSSARLVLFLLAWLGCCVLIYRDYIRSQRKSEQLIQLKYVAEEWRARVHMMEGKNVDKLDDAELKKLNMLQQLGYDRIKNLINLSIKAPVPAKPSYNFTANGNTPASTTPSKRLSIVSRPVDWDPDSMLRAGADTA